MPILAIPAIVAAGVGAAGSVAGAAIGAVSQGSIAGSQAAQAAQNRQLAMQQAAPTAQELSTIQNQLDQQSRYQSIQAASVQRDTSILNTLDPSLVQAGQQASQLMSGQSAAILAPMKQQQTMERNQLQASLAAQFGPGYASSSAGQQALQQFDMSSNLQLQQAQMQAFNNVTQYMNYGIQSSNAINSSDRLMAETSDNMSAQALRGMNAIQTRQINAIEGSSAGMNATAGSQFAGASAAGEAIGSMGAGLLKSSNFTFGSTPPPPGPSLNQAPLSGMAMGGANTMSAAGLA
jgi:hypothetical protein